MLVKNEILGQVKENAMKVLSTELPDGVTYHSINHTYDVVKSAKEIATQQGLNEDDMEAVLVAAWFHDIGYTKGIENHEKEGANIACDFLYSHDYPKEKVEKVVGCILATKMPQNPTNNLEQIICDADMMHLADHNYFAKADLLHKEIEHTKVCKISESQWLEMNQEFLDNHCFFTDYAKKNYQSAVKENLKKVRDRLKSWKKTKK